MKPTLTRRTLLRGAATALALPLLPSALPRAARAEEVAAPLRMVIWYVPNGLRADVFVPDRLGEGYDLKETTQALAPIQGHVSVLSGLSNLAAEDVVPGDHARGTGSFLTCVPVRRTAGNDIYNGISMDQVAANARGHETPFPSLQLGIQPGGNTGDCTAGYSCAYTRNVAWANEITPLPNLTDPRLLFERLFGVEGSLDPAVRLLRSRVDASLLDDVRLQAEALNRRLGVEDRAKLDQYLTAVREVEVRVQSLGQGSCGAGEPPPAATALSYPDHVATMNELLALALQCDLTRIATFMIGPAASNQTYDFVGVPGAHHQVSHHQNDPKNLADLAKIGAWEVGRFAELVARLADTPDGEDGSLLDHSLVLFSSEIEDGDRHTHRNLPVLLAGGAGGAHLPGKHRRYAGDRPIADLFLWMLQTFGVEADRFGIDGTRPLEDLAS